MARVVLLPAENEFMRQAGRRFGPGREGFIRSFEQMPAGPPAATAAPSPAKVLFLAADADRVVRVSSRSLPGSGGAVSAIFNMFRVQDGKLAEHWDSSPPMRAGGSGTGAQGASGPAL